MRIYNPSEWSVVSFEFINSKELLITTTVGSGGFKVGKDKVFEEYLASKRTIGLDFGVRP